jgi:4-hydroxy-2-oxoheptanedioate aldolase
MALDSGAHGIIVPMVNTADDARNAVRFARFPPLGERGVGSPFPHIGFAMTRREYVEKSNGEILLAIQIETKEAVENVEAIVEVGGIDVVFIGPGDLHMSLGIPGRMWSEGGKFKEAVQKVRAACDRKGIPLGVYCLDSESAKKRITEKFTFVGIGSDGHFMLTHAGVVAGEVREEKQQPEDWAGTLRGLGV